MKYNNILNHKLLFCIDSKSALISLQNSFNKNRTTPIHDIHLIIHDMIVDNFEISFLWIPSHCGLYGNETVDKAAKAGVNNSVGSTHINISAQIQMCYRKACERGSKK